MPDKKAVIFRRWVFFLIILLVYPVMIWQIWQWVKDDSLNELSAGGHSQLNLYVTHLKGQLEKYKFLPELLSTNKRLVDLLQKPGDSERAEALNRYLETVNSIAGAADTYLMDQDGLTIAASNWQSERPFVGRNFSYRPYFRQAIQGGLGRYFALGTTSRKRGYYFAFPVRNEDDILGAVVIKIDMTSVEEQWGGRKEEIVVTDPDGIVFITTRPEWRFRSLIVPLSNTVRERVEASKRYPQIELKPSPLLQEIESRFDAEKLVRLQSQELKSTSDYSDHYLIQTRAMPEAGWHVHLLTPLDVINERLLIALGIATSVFTVVILLGLFVRQRYKRRKERNLYEAKAQEALRDAHDQLEQRVQDRTIELRREIEERRNTEAALRRTQDELIQAAKLAVIGQMSTGISHEINQPLAAIRSYSDNALRLMQCDRKSDVKWNLTQISELTEHMAHISSQLKLFARKTDGEVTKVSLSNAIDASCSILQPQFRKLQTELITDLPQDTNVMANPVQLEQVLVNLFCNAMNAMEKQEQGWIKLTAADCGENLCVTIHDNGSGIEPEHLEQIFDPFFTTRETGLGLGLSISHRIIEGMGGSLKAANHPEGGAIFTMELKKSQS
jgi:two-component system C4-dicarboxylate transport sensor histidine kinase DctB